jgi:hypothetical protein
MKNKILYEQLYSFLTAHLQPPSLYTYPSFSYLQSSPTLTPPKCRDDEALTHLSGEATRDLDEVDVWQGLDGLGTVHGQEIALLGLGVLSLQVLPGLLALPHSLLDGLVRDPSGQNLKCNGKERKEKIGGGERGRKGDPRNGEVRERKEEKKSCW